MDWILKTENLDFNGTIRYPEIGVERGKLTFLCGESGCGKSTLLRMINKTVTPAGGTVFYEGKDILGWDTINLRREVLLMNQNVFLFDGSVIDNFKEYYSYREESCPEREKILECLSLCRMEPDLSAFCGRMSGGERQRVFAAICLSMMPRVLMMDEPTSALDERTGRELMGRVKNFAAESGMTMLCVSHDRRLAESLGDRIIELGGERS